MKTTLQNDIETLCHTIIEYEYDNYREWLQEYEDTGKDHLYSLALSILSDIENGENPQ